jgi:hypothetical protein
MTLEKERPAICVDPNDSSRLRMRFDGENYMFDRAQGARMLIYLEGVVRQPGINVDGLPEFIDEVRVVLASGASS